MNHRLPALFGSAVVLLVASAALAQPSADGDPGPHADVARPLPAAPEPIEVFEPELVFDTGRTEPTPPDPDHVRGEIHGEYQVRLGYKSELPLTPPPADPSADTLGQTFAVSHWLRLTPRVDFRKDVSIVGQIDVPYGYFLGTPTQYVGSANEPLDDRNPIRVAPRWLYLQAMTPIGLLRFGQQGSHWGTGMLANDGDHPRLFGDYAGGSIAERILFATRPFGKESPFAVLVAGDLVYKDEQADLRDGDRALQGLIAGLLGDEVNEVGVYGAIRRQQRSEESIDEFSPYTERLDVMVFDAFGKFAAEAPGGGAYVFGEAEAAVIKGETDYVRTPELGARAEAEQILTWGGMAKVGVVRVAHSGDTRWGDIAVAVEWGYASGDADPNDGDQRRFNFDPNHKVGLVLFDHVMAWTTARSAVNAGDDTLVQRANPGLQFYPSNGGVFGATYVYPTLVVRPKHWLDLKAAMLVAHTTADVVDPYQFGVHGSVTNARGGDPKRHDLGLELDGGFEARVGLAHDMTFQLGAQAGVLMPGHAFDDPDGNALPTQGVVIGRLGLQY